MGKPPPIRLPTAASRRQAEPGAGEPGRELGSRAGRRKIALGTTKGAGDGELGQAPGNRAGRVRTVGGRNASRAIRERRPLQPRPR